MTQQLESRGTLNFNDKNKVQTLSLDDLKATYLEHNVKGEPVNNGIYHFVLINTIIDLCKKHNIDYDVQEIFAAQNKRKGNNGVVIAPHMEERYGTNAIEAHALRRVFTTIRINNLEDDETNTGLVIAYHQDGIQIAIGPNIKMCTNQCILGKSRMIQTYGGKDKVQDLDKVFDVVDDWLFNFNTQRMRDVQVLDLMKRIQTTYKDVMELIGRLNTIRVAKDSKDNRLKKNTNLKDTYPLNQGQISDFVEKYLTKCIDLNTTDMSLYDVYNIVTELYKPDITDIPGVISQNMAWTEFIIDEFDLERIEEYKLELAEA